MGLDASDGQGGPDWNGCVTTVPCMDAGHLDTGCDTSRRVKRVPCLIDRRRSTPHFLRKIVFDTHLFDQSNLGFQPINMLLLAFENIGK